MAEIKKKAKKQQKKKGAGRPSKYDSKLHPLLVERFTQRMSTKKFFSFCGVEHVCVNLGICKDTCYRWQKLHSEFSDAIKKWETKRNAIFYALSNVLPPGVWVFLAKNWLGMTDKSEFDFGKRAAKTLRLILDDGNSKNNRNGKADKAVATPDQGAAKR